MLYKLFHQYREWLPKVKDRVSVDDPPLQVKSIVIKDFDFVGGKANFVKIKEKAMFAEVSKRDRQRSDLIDSMDGLFIDLTVQTACDIEQMIGADPSGKVKRIPKVFIIVAE